MQRILIVEDDYIMGESLQTRFELEGYDALWVTNITQAKEKLMTEGFCLVVSDYQLPDGTGDDLAQFVNQLNHHPTLLFMTAYSTIERVISLMKQGAADFFTKPFDIERLIERVNELVPTSLQHYSAEAQKNALGRSKSMVQIQEIIHRVCQQANGYLVTGESGVGKEKIAQYIHQVSQGNVREPFVAVNCAALPENLIESELYGQEKGAFTGAVAQRIGLIEQANNGTLFLDEIGDMPLHLQTRLLRVIQERELTRLGGNRTIKVDFRLICATHQNLPEMIKQGLFREDLYYRINFIALHIPPLRSRKEDILVIGQHILNEANELHQKHYYLDETAKTALLNYPWPGNVRELKQTLLRACMMAMDSRLTAADLFTGQTLSLVDHSEGQDANLQAYLKKCERNYIVDCLQQHQNKIALTAEFLGISRKNLWEKMRKLDITA